MIPPPIPANDAARVRTLRSLGILDTPAEERFDRITRLARRLFDVPIALVSLVDEDRQWFKSRQGIEDQETSREVSFCAHAITGEGILQVPDATTDPRFHDNPSVLEDPNIRFYAGCPIEAPDGQRMGTLCVVDRSPRELGPEDLEALEDLAGMVEKELAAMQLALSDELTGLANRRGFMGLGRQVLSVCERMGIPATLVFLDLDNMKTINDTHGHGEGDAALQDLARLAEASFRDSDVIGRVGGDEFCILLTGAVAGVGHAIGRFGAAIDEHNASAGRSFELSVSVGTAAFDPLAPVDVEALMEAADASMYEAKRGKRAAAR